MVLTVHGSIQFTALEYIQALMLKAKKKKINLDNLSKITEKDLRLSAFQVSVSASASKTLAAIITYPLTLIKTRLQVYYLFYYLN